MLTTTETDNEFVINIENMIGHQSIILILLITARIQNPVALKSLQLSEFLKEVFNAD